jgi:hypothetical protein
VVTRIDGRDGRKWQLHELRTRLRGLGDEVALSYRRGQAEHRVTLRLRRLI